MKAAVRWLKTAVTIAKADHFVYREDRVGNRGGVEKLTFAVVSFAAGKFAFCAISIDERLKNGTIHLSQTSSVVSYRRLDAFEWDGHRT